MHHTVQLAMWYCPNHVELSIFTGAELLNPRWLLLQNAFFCGTGPSLRSHPSTHLHSLFLLTDALSLRAGAVEGAPVVRAGSPGCASLWLSARSVPIWLIRLAVLG